MGAHGSSYAPKPKGLSSVDILEDPFDALTLAHGGAFTPRTFQDLCGFVSARSEESLKCGRSAERRAGREASAATIPIGLGRIEEGHALIKSRADQLDRFILVQGGTESEAHAAETDGGDFPIASSEVAFCIVFFLWRESFSLLARPCRWRSGTSRRTLEFAHRPR
jgi:hypothetical protein